jgi:hypothetical protein
MSEFITFYIIYVSPIVLFALGYMLGIRKGRSEMLGKSVDELNKTLREMRDYKKERDRILNGNRGEKK